MKPAILLCCALAFSNAAPEQQLTVYSAQLSYSLPVLDRDGKAYISVTDLLSPLGSQPPRTKGKEWWLQLNNSEIRMTEGKEKAAVHNGQLDLGGKVLVENNRLLMPVTAAAPVLNALLKTSVDFHQPSRRIFIGNTFTRFAASFTDGQQPSLTLNFSQPVKPNFSHEETQGALFTKTDRTTLIFEKDPLVADTNQQQFGNGPIQSLVFTEENGTASLTITGNARLNIVRSEDGKTIVLQPAAPVAAATPASQPASASEGQRRPQEFFVMIDPSHGGYDKGASFGGKLLEKDVTLKLGRVLKKELDEREIPSRMLRDSDVDISLDRRAEITNEQRASLYIALHAGRPGRGIRVYTPLLSNPQHPVAGRFLPWENAQAAALDRSKLAARAIADEMQKKGYPVAMLGTPLRPLNNVMTPAVIVELAPEGDDLQSLESAKRNTGVASAIAEALVQLRSRLGAHP